ncbi:MAG: hypothetical protein IJN41_04265, partial [Firmicutes bacterium]|nr:hypothetical protein [Bacillota bacterium]
NVISVTSGFNNADFNSVTFDISGLLSTYIFTFSADATFISYNPLTTIPISLESVFTSLMI